MALPKQIREQIEKTAEIHNKVYKPEEDKAEQPAIKAVEVEAEPEEQEPETQPEEAASESPPAEPAKEQEKPEEDWAWKYKVLQGKFDAEVPRLNSENAQLLGRVQSLEAMLANLNKPAVSEKEDRKRPAGNISLVKPEEIEDYGEDLIDVVGRRAQEVFSPELEELREELRELRSKFGVVETATVQTRTDKVHDKLTQEVENWRELNENADFLNWLGQSDPYSGEMRRDLLQRAYQAGDAGRVVRFFKGFLSENAAMSAPSEPSAAPAKQPKIDTEDLVQPGKARATSTSQVAQSGKRLWTSKEIADFYSDVRRGKFRKNPEKQRSIEADILTANREGRIRQV